MLNPEWSKAVEQWARSIPCISSVHFVGSRVKGDARPDSDLDIAITMEEPCGYTDWFYGEPQWSVQLQPHIPVSVHLLRGGGALSNPVVEKAVKEYGLLVYQRATK